MIRHLSAIDFRTMPWSNGKGTTVELLRVERAGRLVLRLSRALVVEEGPFSLFPGIERNLTVLSGPGFDLVGDDIHFAARLLRPVAFPGDVPLRAAGVRAP
jgi:environmental stress-induced protein Ves